MLLKNAWTGFAVMTAIALSLATQANAQSLATELGEFEFNNSCAACHGVNAKGAGGLAELLTTPPPDLTTLQANNGGVFPVSSVYAMIEGEAEVAAHGSREMPVWGVRYMQRSKESADLLPSEAEQYPRMRILALIEYLSTIQEE